MIKEAYTLTDLDENSVASGKLKIGDFVTPKVVISSPDETHYVYPDKFYKVVKFLPPKKYPGGFIIDADGETWGFWFGKDGLGDQFQKAEFTKQEVMEEKYGELPYKVLSLLKEKQLLTLDEIVNILLKEKLSVPPENVKSVKNEIIKTIYALQELNFIVPTRVKKKGQRTFMLTNSGKQYLEA
jgi:hypothetical protein